MGQVSQHLAEALNRIKPRTVTSLITGHDCLREYLHGISIPTDKPIFRLGNEEKEEVYHVVLECVALGQRKLSLLGSSNLLTGTNLFM